MSFSAGSTMARASSGSRSSISSIEPLMSANSVVTVLRSPSGVAVSKESVTRTVESADRGAVSAAASRRVITVEHWEQNLARGGFSAPHDGHRCANGAAHSIQNLAVSGFSTPQFEQRIRSPPLKNEQLAPDQTSR